MGLEAPLPSLVCVFFFSHDNVQFISFTMRDEGSEVSVCMGRRYTLPFFERDLASKYAIHCERDRRVLVERASATRNGIYDELHAHMTSYFVAARTCCSW